MELGKIHSKQQLTCPHCNLKVDDVETSLLPDSDIILCPNCKGKIRLPEIATKKLAEKSYLGKNIDISC